MNEDELEEERIHTNAMYADEDEIAYLQEYEENMKSFSGVLPAAVKAFQEDACNVAHYNDIPAAASFFVILGQICKDFIKVPNGFSVEDSRIHFLQIQTSGTGKSTLYNFVGPVSKRVFKMINDTNSHPLAELIPSTYENEFEAKKPKHFNTFSTTLYTDAALTGHYTPEMVTEGDDKGQFVQKRVAGELEGSGLAHWDEFEYSGIFHQTQHKQDAIVMLNTFMNTLHGESWIVSKKLKDGDTMFCFNERSVLAMTYPPNKLESVITEKGVLQRMLVFIWDVPPFIQDKMRRKQIFYAGKVMESNLPIDKHAKRLFKIYSTVKERWEEVNKDGLRVMTFSPDFNEVLEFEYEGMEDYIQSTRPEVRKIASNFTTRLLKILIKMSVLCSVAQSPSITNKEERFIVTGYNVRQATTIVRQCYMTLVDWLERSLKVRSQQIADKGKQPQFIKVFTEMKADEDGFVNKKTFLEKVKKETSLGKSRMYELWNQNAHLFEADKQGRSVFIKLKEEKK
jgi:hypothetical protein